MMKFRFFILLGAIVFIHFSVKASPLDPDNTKEAQFRLDQIKMHIRQKIKNGETDIPLIRQMLKHGLWTEAQDALNSVAHLSSDHQILKARLHMLNNDFWAAEKIVNTLLDRNPDHIEAVLWKSYLEIQAWRLPQASAICESAIQKSPSEKLWLMLGRIRLFQKKYEEAMAIAERMLKKKPSDAEAYLLKADVYFWNQKPELAEAPLRRSLELDPFNADARFSYGYAIWRRTDATQLDAMAAQWELALNIDPLHYQTHWHWGNGHTNLTYADYIEPEDEQVRKDLQKADNEIKKNNVETALEITRKMQEKYPYSVLPLMARGAYYYMAFDMDRKIRLDSAENIFRHILERKKHYGPAHNGLSAVIKSKRIPFLASYDSIMLVLKNTRITDSVNFEKVFSDVAVYPGTFAKAMVWQQMYASVVYFPFLSRQNKTFHVPPLHIDLATVMGSSFFRFATTFDNRQWMDIRGVGSGAAAIEYVERGAFLERNVVLHEFVHQFHGSVLTEEENRQIRSLYYQAMKENRTLDYYSQNNESEYFAQTYPAYFEPVKVHPLDFKSMNTTSDLRNKDPEMYRFIDLMVKKQQAYLNGDKSALAGNWAQVYINLANDAVRIRKQDLAFRLLDTALTYQHDYLPIYLAYARIKRQQQKFSEAERWLKKAEKINPEYAPVFAGLAALSASRLEAGQKEQEASVKEQISLLKKAYETEQDFQEKARFAILLRDTYKQQGRLAEAVKAAEDYIKAGASVSTYLRDRRNDAIAFAEVIRASLGYTESLNILQKLVTQKPQNFEYRNNYADALARHQQYDRAIATLNEAQKILSASGNPRPDYELRIIEYYHHQGKKDSAQKYLKLLSEKDLEWARSDSLRYIRLLNLMSFQAPSSFEFKKIFPGSNPMDQAEYYYTLASLCFSEGKVSDSQKALEKAVSLNPYLMEGYENLVKMYRISRNHKKIWKLKATLMNLYMPPEQTYLKRIFGSLK